LLEQVLLPLLLAASKSMHTVATTRLLALFLGPPRKDEFINKTETSICRLFVTFMHPTQPVEIFSKISMPVGMLAIR